MDVCGDREDPIAGIDGAMVADAVRPGTAHVTYEPGWDDAAPTVAGIARPGDLVITVGCGDVTKVAPQIVAELAAPGRPRLEEPDEFDRDRDPTGRTAAQPTPSRLRRPALVGAG